VGSEDTILPYKTDFTIWHPASELPSSHFRIKTNIKITKSGGWTDFDMKLYVETALLLVPTAQWVFQTAALALAGNALTTNIYLDIPPLIRGLQHCFVSATTEAREIALSDEMLQMLKDAKPDPRHPSSVLREYAHAWWTLADDWQNHSHQLVDIEAAFEFHEEKVSYRVHNWPILNSLVVRPNLFAQAPQNITEQSPTRRLNPAEPMRFTCL
jgi:hypothetical protein